MLKEAKESRTGLFLALAVGLGLGAGLLAILQAGVLSHVVSGAFLGGQGPRQLWPLLWVLLGLLFARALFIWLGESCAHRAAAQVKLSLRRRLLAHLFALGPAYAGGERAGELTYVLVEGVDSLEAFFSRYLPQLALAVLIPLTVLGFAFPADPLSGWILLITAPLIPVFMILIGKWAESLTQRQWETLSRLSAHFLDVLQGLTTLKIFGRSKDQIQVVARVSRQFRDTTLAVLRVAFLSALVLELLATISTALVAVGLGLRLVYGRLEFERAFFLLLLAPEFYQPLRLLGTQFHAGLSGATAAKRIYAVLETPLPGSVPAGETDRSAPSEPSQACLLQARLAGMDAPQVVFSDVHYAYEGGLRPALSGVTFVLEPGQRVALVGASGAGKSTVAHLLLRFLEPQRGSIQVNGLPLGAVPPELWRQYVAWVPQNPRLFYGTVADNIRLGRPEASLEEVAAAAQAAGAHEFIQALPQGYETPVGELGLKLSGGQAQRIAIARAILKDSPLLILDEATAHLDPAHQREVEQALERLMAGRTTLIIAHRLTTASRADWILVLDAGRLVEEGRHRDLVARGGAYARLVQASRSAAEPVSPAGAAAGAGEVGEVSP
ncbi:MAG: thiol reductant ABC exporter subunit CydD [Firmicutes bacterium]|nr:thiol reductant ABC exporter subunit CydD [Bacillota bacterium]